MVERQSPARDLDRVFHAMANETRRALLGQLSRSEATVTELAAPHDLSFAGVSKHIHVLADAGLVESTRHGKHRRYRTVPGTLNEAADAIAFYRSFWDDRLDGLAGYLNRDGS